MRRVLLQLHLWTALVLFLPLVLLGATGSYLVFFDTLFEYEMSPPLASTGEMRPVSQILAAAAAAKPDAGPPILVGLPDEPGRPAEVRFRPRPAGAAADAGAPRIILLYVDPVSLAILGEREPQRTVSRWIARLHGNFLISDRIGRDLVGWLGVAMLVLGISGLVLWWPRGGRWLSAFTVKRGARGLRLHRDLHGAVGIWGWAVFIVVSLSGTYLAFPKPIGNAVAAVFPARDVRGMSGQLQVKPLPGVERLDIDAAVAMARAIVPDATVRGVSPPNRREQPYRIGLRPPGHADGTPMVTVWIDPWEKRVIQVFDPRTYSLGEKIIAWQHAIHAGDGFGWVYRILVFFCGFMPAIFAVTGIYMWWTKRQRRGAAPSAVKLAGGG